MLPSPAVPVPISNTIDSAANASTPSTTAQGTTSATTTVPTGATIPTQAAIGSPAPPVSSLAATTGASPPVPGTVTPPLADTATLSLPGTVTPPTGTIMPTSRAAATPAPTGGNPPVPTGSSPVPTASASPIVPAGGSSPVSAPGSLPAPVSGSSPVPAAGMSTVPTSSGSIVPTSAASTIPTSSSPGLPATGSPQVPAGATSTLVDAIPPIADVASPTSGSTTPVLELTTPIADTATPVPAPVASTGATPTVPGAIPTPSTATPPAATGIVSPIIPPHMIISSLPSAAAAALSAATPSAATTSPTTASASTDPTKVPLLPNENLRFIGRRSYGRILLKYNITPTIDGPFFRPADPAAKSEAGAVDAFGRPLDGDAFGRPLAGPLMKQRHMPGEGQHSPHMFRETPRRSPTPGAIDEGLVTVRDIEDEAEHTGQVTIGSLGQAFSLCFDTATVDLVVLSKAFAAKLRPPARKRTVVTYDTTTATETSEVAGDTWKIKNGDGSETGGSVFTDTVTVGGFKVVNQPLNAVEHAIPRRDGALEDLVKGQDGSLGLGFLYLSTVKDANGQPSYQNGIVSGIFAQNNVTLPVFTTKLAATATVGATGPGSSGPPDTSMYFGIGSVDDTLIAATAAAQTSAAANGPTQDFSLHSAQVQTTYPPPPYAVSATPNFVSGAGFSFPGYWIVRSASLAVRAGGKAFARAAGNAALLDTSSPLVLLDEAALRRIYAAIPGAGYDPNVGYVIRRPAQSYPGGPAPESWPDVQLDLDGRLFTVDRRLLAAGPIGVGRSEWLFGAFQHRGDLPCDLFGLPFLKNVYGVWNQAGMQFEAVQLKLA